MNTIFNCLKDKEIEKEPEKVKRISKKQELRNEELAKLLEIKAPNVKEKRRISKLMRLLKRKVRRFNDNSQRARIPRKYYVYIQSHWWTSRKNSYFRTHGRKCAKCNCSKYVELHHLFYDSSQFGYENDSDLAPLCDLCHKDFHQQFGVKKNSHVDFRLFLNQK
jgi:hypothetical protein